MEHHLRKSFVEYYGLNAPLDKHSTSILLSDNLGVSRPLIMPFGSVAKATRQETRTLFSCSQNLHKTRQTTLDLSSSHGGSIQINCFH
jgi:hypothetical protein